METTVNKTILPGGLTVVSERMPYVRSVSFGVWIKAGSCTDDRDLGGLAHFLE
ncbi:MAG: insulinase family protein, partial [Candidatus Latescibacteria bacterium]|nr:insulinase family protein [Candidatus Latescibacterota bacterium]